MRFACVLLVACGAATTVEQARQRVQSSALDGGPPSFDGVVFPSFESADYTITYDVTAKRASVHTSIVLTLDEAGRLAFDAPQIDRVSIDGAATSARVVTPPGGGTSFYVLTAAVEAGPHSLEIDSALTRGVSFGNGTVLSAFFMSDLADRGFLERYLPTSFEWDPYAMRITVQVRGAAEPHVLETNATQEAPWVYTTPAYYSTSSLFYHLMPQSGQRALAADHITPRGLTIPIRVYARSSLAVDGYLSDARRYLDQMETDFGPWPHGRLLIYATGGGGGMEYRGATATERSALLHELAHSYYARGVGPRDGNSGWIDEAVASWYANNPATPHTLDHREDGKLVGPSPYVRETVGDGYYHGARFLAYLNHRFGLQPCLASFFTAHVFERVDNVTFRDGMTACAGFDLSEDFDAAVFGDEGSGLSLAPFENPVHPPLTDALLQQLL